MAVISSTNDFWMHQNGLTIDINYFGNPQLIQTSLLAGAVILAYRKDVIGYNAAHNFREWKLQAFPTQLSDTCTYYVHVELSRTGNTAMVIYSPVIRDMQGRTLLSGNRVSGTYDDNVSADSWFIYIGTLSASLDSDGNTVERAWTDGVYTGTLATDQYRMEEASGDWVNMFSLDSVTGLIDVLKTISKATINALTVAKEFVFGGKILTGVAGASDTLDQSKVNDATLPTTGYTKKYVGDEIEALDDHFLIKDGEADQEVGGDVTFKNNVTVQGDHTVEGDTDVQSITVHGQASMAGGATFGEFQDVAGNIQGAKVDDKGVGTFAGLKSKYFEIYELIYNQQTAEDGVKMFTDRGVIEEVKDITYYGNDRQGTYSDTDEYFKADALIKLRKERDGQLITFKKWDVIHGMVNSIGDSGEYAIGGEAWFRVVSVNQDTFEMEVEIYADRETPAGKNIDPTSSMVIARWGYKGTDDLRRQTSFYLSCEDGNITQLMYVTKPIIGLNNYGSVLGVLPPALYEYVQNAYAYVNPEQPYLYARGIAVQDLMLLDYLGQPIKQARYRGVWNKNTAESDEPYVITETTYDTVTHNGSLWQLNASHTTEPPSDDYGEWTKIVSKGDDSSIASYTIIPDPDKIHLATDGTLSTSTISVKIGEQLPDGTYTEIQDQGELESKGFSVWYAVDGIGERTMLNISPAAIFELEDGSGRIITEEEGYLLLEGEEIDANAISSHIALYLVDAKGIDRAVSFIWIVKDGEKGESPLLFGATPSNLSVTIDAETGKTIEAFEQTVRVFVQRGDTKIYPATGGEQWSVNYDSSFIDDFEYVNEYLELYVKIPKETPKSEIASTIDFEFYFDNDEDTIIGRTSITINKPERGIVGPMGNTGPLPYAAGAWNDTTNYPAATDIAPYVLYPNAENGSYYVRTANEIHKGEDGKDLNPAAESKYGSKGGWRVMQQFEVLFVKMLFANFGRLAKAVFHGDYMFSAMGVSDSGTYASYDAFVDGNANKNEPMFKENGRLSGSFVPNLFLDLENGQLKTNKLSETFVEFKNNGAYTKQIKLSESHNVSVEYGTYPRLIAMPTPTDIIKDGVILEEVPYEPDGVNSSIIMQPDLKYIQAKDLQLGGQNGDDLVNFWNTAVILCADGRLFDERCYRWNQEVETFVFAPQDEQIFSQTNRDGYFVINGKLTKILILDPTSFVRLRSFTTNAVFNNESTVYKTKYWYVENGEDFVEQSINVNINLCKDKDGEWTDDSNPYKIALQFIKGQVFGENGSYTAAYASKFLADYATEEEMTPTYTVTIMNMRDGKEGIEHIEQISIK